MLFLEVGHDSVSLTTSANYEQCDGVDENETVVLCSHGHLHAAPIGAQLSEGMTAAHYLAIIG